MKKQTIASRLTNSNIATAMAAAVAEHNKTMNNLRRQAYEEFVASGAKETEAAEHKARIAAATKARYATRTGITVHSLRQSGVTVVISHIRYADGMPVPSYMRKSFSFSPRGGATHITLEKNGNEFTVSSVCHDTDSFDYKLGVTKALNLLTDEDLALLHSEETEEVGCDRTVCCGGVCMA